MRKHWAIQHRIDAKKILESNIKLCQILARILARLQIAFIKSGGQFTKAQFKAIYMERVDEFEPVEEVLLNRLRLRKYLRELVLN